jgi:glyoxylase-like metal-dependent hydrolase (beta-lactamase superfamily II)
MGKQMTVSGYYFDIGKYKCTIFSDGTLGNPESEDEDVFGLNCLLIETGDQKVLIDTGCGDGFQATAGLLARNMELDGINPGDIDIIIFTHGHIDHAAGSFSSAGKPVFPNARYITSKREWGHWLLPPGNNELHNMFFESARKNLLPIANQFILADDNVEVLPGIKLIPASGHTPGNIMVEISSAGENVLCIGDIIHSQKEFINPEYLVMFDVNPEQAVSTRQRILSRIVDSEQLVFACHFDFPGLGYITTRDGNFNWQPI